MDAAAIPRDAQSLVDAHQTRNEMLATGVGRGRGEVFGSDLATIERIGIQVEQALRP
jgi:hypothetical protein